MCYRVTETENVRDIKCEERERVSVFVCVCMCKREREKEILRVSEY